MPEAAKKSRPGTNKGSKHLNRAREDHKEKEKPR